MMVMKKLAECSLVWRIKLRYFLKQIADRSSLTARHRIFLALLLLIPRISYGEVSTSDPLWDWKYDAIERLSLAFGEGTVSNTRPYSRLEMADMVLRLAAKVEAEAEDEYHRVLLKRLEDDLRDEIEAINHGTAGDLRVKPIRWIRAKAVHSEEPFQLENDYGFKAREMSVRGELSTSGTWGFLGYEIRPEYNMLRDDDAEDEDELDLHSGYLVLWLKNLEIEVGKDSLWWGPGRHGAWLLTNNAPAFELIKVSNAVTAVPPGPLRFLGDTKFTAFLGRLDKQHITYLDKGARVDEHERPFLGGIRLDFVPATFLEAGLSQVIQFTDRGGRGYSADYIGDLLLPTHDSNEVEATSGPVANRITSLDVSLNMERRNPLLQIMNLQGMKLYWMVGGETMNSGGNSLNFPWFANTANLFGLYLDNGRTEFRAEYASNYDASASWYDHYQFTEGYRNEGFILGHPHMAGNSKDLFLSLSHPFSDNVATTLHFDRREQRTAGPVFREDAYGLSIDAFLKRGEVGISYEYRERDNPEDINHVWAVEGVYRF
jgi:hypothetical protein